MAAILLFAAMGRSYIIRVAVDLRGAQFIALLNLSITTLVKTYYAPT